MPTHHNPCKPAASKLGRRLRALRTELKYSQREVAAMTGLTTCAIWKLERKPHPNPTLFVLLLLARCYHVPLADLLSDISHADLPHAGNATWRKWRHKHRRGRRGLESRRGAVGNSQARGRAR